ncbi:hypothetical protein LH23_20030 [Cedecea neteri]|uniref:Uncharacterized protein n=1 Tax=Cedecea neteri TaxID=158822 RepID=A0AAN0S7B7_9ENTR|nr:hypothetical protein [Cedecea neteri]AIR62863.1 hypothetical protein LH23_20030 [Cedecea neteri]
MDTIADLASAIWNYDKTYDAIKISVAEWNQLYDYALVNNPELAGQMVGSLQGKVLGDIGGNTIVSGATVKIIQKVARMENGIKMLPDANGKLYVTMVSGDAHVLKGTNGSVRINAVWRVLPSGEKRLATVTTGTFKDKIMSKKSRDKLILELDNYIKYGCADINSFDNPPDEAASALAELHFHDAIECEGFCKEIILTEGVGDIYLDSLCLMHLFELNKEYALQYVEEHVLHMSAPVLGIAMDGLVQYSGTPFRIEFSDDLISKIYTRYKEISADPFYAEMLEATYRFFSEEYPENNDNSQR